MVIYMSNKKKITCLGFGGVGDCFIVILKLLECKIPLIYTHVDDSAERIKISSELLNKFNIEHNCLFVNDIRTWWYANNKRFDKCFNVFAMGYINIPLRAYHWQPCIDEGYKNPFNNNVPIKTDYVAVQVASGGQRSYKYKPVVEYTLDNYPADKVMWFGLDNEFDCKYGINYCCKLTFFEALDKIAACKYFVGFPSVLLYWSLWNKSDCFVFVDHQGKDDLRIHKDWKKYIKYDEDILQ